MGCLEERAGIFTDIIQHCQDDQKSVPTYQQNHRMGRCVGQDEVPVTIGMLYIKVTS